MSTNVTLVGRLGRDPELRFTNSGQAVCKMSLVTSKPRKLDNGTWEDTEVTWWNVTVWREQAERCAEALRKGHPVIVVGRTFLRQYDRNDGTKGTSLDVEAYNIGIDLRWVAADVHESMRREKAASASSGGGQAQRQTREPAPADDPWATRPAPAAATSTSDAPW